MDADLRRSAPVFAALGDETRLQIVARLCSGGPASISQLTGATAVTRQAVTKHLVVLSSAGLVRDRRVGRERIWEMEHGQLDTARRCLDRIGLQWNLALSRLKAPEGE